MPKLPVVSGAELVRILEQFGYARVSQTGSHLKLRRGAMVCVVPLHRELKRGAVIGILGQANITRDEFLRSVLH